MTDDLSIILIFLGELIVAVLEVLLLNRNIYVHKKAIALNVNAWLKSYFEIFFTKKNGKERFDFLWDSENPEGKPMYWNGFDLFCEVMCFVKFQD